MSDGDFAREGIREICRGIIDAVSQDAPIEDDAPISAMITKCVVITEWVDPNGHRWLTRRMLMGDGTPGTVWDASGLLYEALHGSWQKDDDAD